MRLSLLASIVVAVGSGGATAFAQSTDTIRVGSQRLAPIRVGTDTFDVVFESATPNGPQRRQHTAIRSVTRELRGRDTVVHVRFGSVEASPYWIVSLDPRDMSLVRFEQHTAIDSFVVARRGDCFTGWVDMEKAARRTIECDRLTDRFAGTPMDEHLVALLPLRAGQSSVLATYGPMSSEGTAYAFAVTGEDTLTVAGRSFRAWRVERRVTSDYGTYVTTIWVDRARPRVLRFDREFGRGARSITTLRHP